MYLHLVGRYQKIEIDMLGHPISHRTCGTFGRYGGQFLTKIKSINERNETTSYALVTYIFRLVPKLQQTPIHNHPTP